MIAALRRIPPLEGSLLLLAFAALLVLGVLQSQKTAEPPSYEAFSSFDASGAGYGAFYDLLAREGLRVERFEQRPAFLDPDVGTLVYAEAPSVEAAFLGRSPDDLGALGDWVRAGGNLLFLGEDAAAARRGVLHLPRARDGRPGAVPVPAAGVRTLRVATGRRWSVAKGERVLYADGRGAVAVTYPFGRGRVTAVVDPALFENAELARGDDARFAYALASQGPRGSVVAFDEALHGHVIPLHWWSVVPRPFLFAIVGACIVLAVAFAGAAVRFGPPLVPVERDDRTSADFIDALSSLLARGGAIRKALTDAAGSTARTVARARGLGDGASNEEIAANIEGDGARAAFREMLAVAAGGFADERNLVRGVALAQRLRKEFAAHGRQRY